MVRIDERFSSTDKSEHPICGPLNGTPFNRTCKILLGKDLGGIEEYTEYLTELVEKPMHAKSFVSGKEVVLSRSHYAKDAAFVALDELGKLPAPKSPKLNMDDIKDIDSILSAIRENLHYCGNSNIGNSMEVAGSDACNDSSFVLSSHQCIRSKNVAYTYGARECESVFGCMLVGEVNFSIRAQVTFKSTRCFESYLSINSSDLFCSFNCRSCHGALFSFNQTAKRNLIGNNELGKEGYLALRSKLVSEVAEGLERKKSFPSLFELAGGD